MFILLPCLEVHLFENILSHATDYIEANPTQPSRCDLNEIDVLIK